MKTLLNYALGLFTVMSLSNCANGKKLQEEAPVALQEAYYLIHRAQDDSNATRLNLYIPAGDLGQKEVQLDSVYFRGRSAELVSNDGPVGYVAYFEISGKDRDLVMHVDPKEEFGNKVPILEKIPFELKNDEAVVVYTHNGKKAYFKIDSITERGSSDGEIKKPENIRH